MAGQVAVLTEQDDGRSVTLRPGETATVSLAENATTGYRWSVEAAESAHVAVSEDGANYPSGAVGAGGRVAWTIRAVSPGTAVVAFRHWRPWEGEKSVVQRVRVTVQVEG